MIKKTFVFLFLFLPFLSYSQTPHFRIHKIIKNSKDINVNAIFQDNNGFLWFGTNKGLIKFDGVNYLLFTKNDSLIENNVTALTQDSIGNLWIGHKNGKISIYDYQTFKPFSPEEGIGSVEITSMLSIKDEIWYSTLGEGIYGFLIKGKKKRLYNFNTEEGITDNYVYCLTLDNKGNIWAGTDQGISIFKPGEKKITSISMKDGLPDNIVKNIIIDSLNNAWIAMEDNGLCIYKISTAKFIIPESWSYGSINKFLLYKPDEVWVSTKRKGIIKMNFYNNDFFYKVFGSTQGILSNNTTTLYKDCENNIWIGSNGGITQFTGDLFQFLNEGEGFTMKDIFSLLSDRNGRYWISCAKGLFTVLQSNKGQFSLKPFFKGLEFKQSLYTSLYEDDKGYIWSGTLGEGIIRIQPDNGSYSVFTQANGLADNNIISITGKNDEIWISTAGGGVSYCKTADKIKFKNFSTSTGLTSDYVYYTFLDSKNRLWFATDGGGINLMENGIMSKLNDTTLTSRVFYSIIEDKLNNLWFTTADDGVYKYDGNKFMHFTELDGLSSNLIRSIHSDKYGNILFVSNEGIDIYNPFNQSIQSYGEDKGVANLEPDLNSIFEDRYGRIWIGTNQGIVIYTPETPSQKQLKPKILITSKKIFFNEIPIGKVKFNHSDNHLTFEYIGLWYQDPSQLIYRHKLEGYDLDWINSGTSRTVTYSNLPSGRYIFRVEVKYKTGVWTGSPKAVYSFKIRPPFWKTWWFISFSVILLITGLYSFIRLRLHNLERAKEILEDEVRKRTAEILMQKEEIETQRDEIEDKNKHITQSIQYASRIQTAILPPTEIFSSFLPEYFVFYQPRDIVSGDFFWIQKKNEKIILVAADCTGHGVPGAFMSMLGITLLNEITIKTEIQHSNEIIELLRDNIKTSLRQTGKEGEARDGMDLALCIIDPVKKEIEFSGANNPLYQIHQGELIVYKPDKMPVGIHVNEKAFFTCHTVPVHENDVFYIFSDGYCDQFGGPNNIKFSQKRLKELLLTIHQKPIEEQGILIKQNIEDWMGGSFQVDDMMVIGFKAV